MGNLCFYEDISTNVVNSNHKKRPIKLLLYLQRLNRFYASLETFYPFPEFLCSSISQIERMLINLRNYSNNVNNLKNPKLTSFIFRVI